MGFGEHSHNSWSGELESSHQLCPLIPLEQGRGNSLWLSLLGIPGAGKGFVLTSGLHSEFWSRRGFQLFQLGVSGAGKGSVAAFVLPRAPLHSSLLPLSFGLNRALCTIWIMLTIAYLEPVFSPVSLLPSLLPFPSPFSPPEGWAGLLAASWLWCWLLLEPKPVLCPIKVP